MEVVLSMTLPHYHRNHYITRSHKKQTKITLEIRIMRYVYVLINVNTCFTMVYIFSLYYLHPAILDPNSRLNKNFHVPKSLFKAETLFGAVFFS